MTISRGLFNKYGTNYLGYLQSGQRRDVPSSNPPAPEKPLLARVSDAKRLRTLAVQLDGVHAHGDVFETGHLRAVTTLSESGLSEAYLVDLDHRLSLTDGLFRSMLYQAHRKNDSQLSKFYLPGSSAVRITRLYGKTDRPIGHVAESHYESRDGDSIHFQFVHGGGGAYLACHKSGNWPLFNVDRQQLEWTRLDEFTPGDRLSSNSPE